MTESRSRLRLAFFLPHFDAGGIEKLVLNLLLEMDRTRFEPILTLGSRKGVLLDLLPNGVEVHDIGGRTMSTAPKALAALFTQLECDLVYSGTNAANLAVLTAGWLMRRPTKFVVSEHTSIDTFFAEAKWPTARRAAMRLLYRRADLVAVPYAPLGDELRKALGQPGLRVAQLLNPVLAAEPKASTSIAGRDIVVAAGRLEPVKGFDLLVHAFAPIARERPELDLYILGEGGERDRLAAQAARLGIPERVRLPGYVDDPAVWFRRARCLVVSSRREGIPNVIVEAMAQGAPVVAANCSSGIRWLLDGGRAGLLVSPNQAGELTTALRRVLDDKKLAARLGEAGCAQARQFTYAATVPAIESAFLDLASGARAASV